MTWSSSGSAATYPSSALIWDAGKWIASAPADGIVVPLTFRLDPQSLIVYVSGRVSVSGGTVRAMNSANPLPVSFRPKRLQALVAVSTDGGVDFQYSIDTAGVVTALAVPTSGHVYNFNGLYLADV